MSSELRRKSADDRRIIERVSSPHIRMHLQQIKWMLILLAVIFGGMAIYNLISVGTVTEFIHGAPTTVVFIVLAILMWRYYSAVILYLTNESSSNLDRTMERQSVCWMAISFFVVIYIIKYFITK